MGDRFVVEVDLVADGHDLVGGVLLFRRRGEATWREAALQPLTNDRFFGAFELSALGVWQYTVEAWIDEFATWKQAFQKRVEAHQDVDEDLRIGAGLAQAAAERAAGEQRTFLAAVAEKLRSREISEPRRAAAAVDDEFARAVARYPDRTTSMRSSRILEVRVDRAKARFSSWYELFPRSWGVPGRHATFREVEARLGYVAGMGFDVVYLPPIHPIGTTHRKGRNNTLTPTPRDPGSPWAIGSPEGGRQGGSSRVGHAR